VWAPHPPHQGSTNGVLEDFETYLRSRTTRRGTPLADRTIDSKLRILKTLRNQVNLWDSDQVQNLIDRSDWSNGRKQNVSVCYRDWCESKGFSFHTKRYPKEEKLPYIPLEKELDQLIAGFSNSKYAPYLQILKETGLRPVEASRLRPIDFDFDRRILTMNQPAKYGSPRQFRISNNLINMLNPLIAGIHPEKRIWNAKLKNISDLIRKKRNKISDRLGNPKLKRITLKTFRHWKATTEYHKTKDLLHVKHLLGHKSIKNTLVYTHLVDFEEHDQFIVKVASNIDEFTELLELGYNYISDYEDKKILRKRK